jgi:hypothetical protein
LMRTSWRCIGGLGIVGEKGCRVVLALNKTGTLFVSTALSRVDYVEVAAQAMKEKVVVTGTAIVSHLFQVGLSGEFFFSRRYCRKASLTEASSGNSFATSGSSKTMLVPSL